jgi:hypothetical protein
MDDRGAVRNGVQRKRLASGAAARRMKGDVVPIS